MAEFSLEVMQAKRQWSNIFKVLKEKYLQLRILYAVKISFKNKGKKIYVIFRHAKLKGFTRRCTLTRKLKDSVQEERLWY